VTAVLVNSFAGRWLPETTKRKVSETKEKEQLQTLEFVVPTIHCEGCVQVIRDALTRLPQVSAVDGKPTEKHLKVAIQKGSLSREDVAAQISKLGHVVEPAR
jgi:copper chaperone CopZ